jgi:hypothetical protein
MKTPKGPSAPARSRTGPVTLAKSTGASRLAPFLVLVEDPDVAYVCSCEAGDLDMGRVGRIEDRSLRVNYGFVHSGRWKLRIAAELRTDLPRARVWPFDVQAVPEVAGG